MHLVLVARSALLLAVALLATGCEPRAVSIPADLPSGALALQPGDSLLQHAERIRVSDFPQTNLPQAVGQRLVELWSSDPWPIAADDWLGGEALPSGAGTALGFETGVALRRWRCHPALRPDLDGGQLHLLHEGREVRPLFQASAARELQWMDNSAQLLFWWVADEGALVALGARPPGPLSYVYEPDEARGVGHFERGLIPGGEAPQNASELLSRVTVGAVDRRALAAPAPTTLQLEVDWLAGDSLRVAVAVADLGLGWSEAPTPEERTRRGWVDDPRLGLRRLAPRPGQGDGVTFAIEVTLHGEVFPVWSRHVPPGKGWHEETVDLGYFAGQPISLALITRPGRDGSQLFDHGLWGDLTVEGVVDGPPVRPHVVLVDLPGLGSADRTPGLDGWATVSGATVVGAMDVEPWPDASPPGAVRLPAAVSLLTGLRRHDQGVRLALDHLPASMASPNASLKASLGAGLVTDLAAAGYETRGRTEGGHMVPELGFAGGFSRFDFQRLDLDTSSNGSWSRELAWVSSRRSARPLFLFFSSAQMLPPSCDEKDALQRLDGLVADLLRQIDEAFGGEPTLIVVTSDHPRPGAGATVPLLVRWPPGWASRSELNGEGRGLGSAAASTVSILDVAPTILHLAGLQPSHGMDGRSLAER